MNKKAVISISYSFFLFLFFTVSVEKAYTPSPRQPQPANKNSQCQKCAEKWKKKTTSEKTSAIPYQDLGILALADTLRK